MTKPTFERRMQADKARDTGQALEVLGEALGVRQVWERDGVFPGSPIEKLAREDEAIRLQEQEEALRLWKESRTIRLSTSPLVRHLLRTFAGVRIPETTPGRRWFNMLDFIGEERWLQNNRQLAALDAEALILENASPAWSIPARQFATTGGDLRTAHRRTSLKGRRRRPRST